MYLPLISPGAKRTRRQVVRLGGLDRTREAGDGSLADSRGLCYDQFPCLSTRRGRQRVRQVRGGSAIFAWDKLCTVEGTTLRYDGAPVGQVAPGPKQFAVAGEKLCVFPDKKYLDLNTMELRDLGARVTNSYGLEAVFTGDALSLTPDTDLGPGSYFIRNIRAKMSASEHRTDEGTYYYLRAYDAVSWDQDTETWTTRGEEELWLMDSRVLTWKGKYVILEEPDAPGERYVNLKKVREVRTANGSTVVNTLEVLDDYSEDNKSGLFGVITKVEMVDRSDLYYGERFVKDVTLTVELHSAGLGNRSFEGRFFPGDRVHISGSVLAQNNTSPERPLTVESVSGHTLRFLVPKGAGEVFLPGRETTAVTVERRIPDLDWVCQGDNRIFGASSAEGRVYASALGDPRNFEVHDGLSTDSWSQQVNSPGDFTGCIAFGGEVLFWKEDCLHRLTGARPSAYQLETRQVAGVQKGGGGSLAILNGTLYYMGRDGVYAYTGGVPRRVSALGRGRWDAAVAGGSGEVYRLCLRRADTGVWEMLSYHAGSGLWLGEGQQEAVGFADLDGTLYLLTADALYALDRGEDDGGEAIPWEVTFNPFTEGVCERKYPSRLLLRLELGEGAWAEAELSRDGGPFWHIWTGRGPGPTAVIPIRPGRCDSYQLRLKGQGRCVLQSLEREFSLGGLR